MSYKTGKWASQIIEAQNDDGTWGQGFHTLSKPVGGRPLTTEQALRRLRILGFTLQDEPIRRAVDYMTACLRGERKMDGSWEKTHDWPLFTQLMLSSWVKIFDPQNAPALAFANRWVRVIETAFQSGAYDDDAYKSAYREEFDSPPKGPRELDFSDFYHLNLLQGVISTSTESRMLDYVINKPTCIYYVYNQPLNAPPPTWASMQTSNYLAALELLSGYPLAKDKLRFTSDWVKANVDKNGQWDLGAKSKDGVYLPLSDSWRNAQERMADCTFRVNELLTLLMI